MKFLYAFPSCMQYNGTFHILMILLTAFESKVLTWSSVEAK
jgi:hypothetical protein